MNDKTEQTISETKAAKPTARAAKPKTDKPTARAAKPKTDKPTARAAKPKTDKPAARAAKPKAGKSAAGAPDAEQSFVQTICAFLSSKKAEDIVIVDVREKTVLCDYFVIASGRNTTQVRALCETLEDKLAESGAEPRRREGIKEGRWGVLDYGDVIVHIFNDESRLFYHLERLWGEGDNVRRFED